MVGARILLVDGDNALSFILVKSLENEGYLVTCCADCTVGWNKFMKERFDLCLVDSFLPGGKKGIDVVKIIRAKNAEVPIVMTSVRPTEEELLDCFRNGADAYLSKPYNIEELLKRIKVFLKRTTAVAPVLQNAFQLGDLMFEFHSRQLKRDNCVIRELTEREGELLHYFCVNRQKVLRKEDILMRLWGKYDEMLERSLTVFVSRLRKYIRSQQSVVIETIPWIGFRMSAGNNAKIHELLTHK